MTKSLRPGRKPLGLRRCSLLLALLLALPAWAQRQDDTRPPPLGPEESVKAGRQLVDWLLAQRPAADSTNTGVLRIRDAGDHEQRIRVRFEIYAGPSNWTSVYQTLPAPGASSEELTVVHSGRRPNEYFLTRPAGAPATPITGDQLLAPFAGSDFAAADLGLEFLHWPEQRVLRKEMRHGQPCAVLESVNPRPAAGGYARVRSWVDEDNGGILAANAYDARGKLIKEFDPTDLKKVNGRYEVEGIEMRSRKAASHTWIKFDLPERR